MTRLRQTIADAAQGSAEHRRDADHLQRRRHDGGDRGARPLQGSVREEARHPPRLHGLLREGGGAGRARRARGQRLRSRATRSSITIISTSRSRSRRPRAWSCPVIRDADAMSFAEIEKAIADFGKRAKDGTLTIEEMTGRHLHHLQRRRVRLAAVDPDHQPAAVGGARHAPDRGAAGRPRRPDRDPPDDVSRAQLRPPPDRRPRGGHLPRPRSRKRSRIRRGC